MANETLGYKIWLRRSGDIPEGWRNNLIIDENIWVGNVPGDGKSKISSGLTDGAEYAYVYFPTWEDLLKAIGEEEETVQVLVTGQFEQIDNTTDTVQVLVTGQFEQIDNMGS